MTLFSTIGVWIHDTAAPALQHVPWPDKPGWGDLAQGAAALVAVKTIDEMRRTSRLGDQANLVVSPADTDLTLRASASQLKATDGKDGPTRLVITNAGPGPAINVIVQCELLIARQYEPLIDTVSPRPFGPADGPELSFVGAPTGVALGKRVGEGLAAVHATYETSTRFRTRLGMMQALATHELTLPPDLVRGWGFDQAVLNEAKPGAQIILRVRVSHRARHRMVYRETLYLALAGGRAKRTDKQVTCAFTIDELDPLDLPKALRRQDVVRSEWRRSVSYLDRTRQQVDQFQGRSRPSLRQRARALASHLRRRFRPAPPQAPVAVAPKPAAPAPVQATSQTASQKTTKALTARKRAA